MIFDTFFGMSLDRFVMCFLHLVVHVFAVRQSLSRKGGTLEFDECLKEFAVFLKYARREFMKKLENYRSKRLPSVARAFIRFWLCFWLHLGSFFGNFHDFFDIKFQT